MRRDTDNHGTFRSLGQTTQQSTKGRDYYTIVLEGLRVAKSGLCPQNGTVVSEIITYGIVFYY